MGGGVLLPAGGCWQRQKPWEWRERKEGRKGKWEEWMKGRREGVMEGEMKRRMGGMKSCRSFVVWGHMVSAWSPPPTSLVANFTNKLVINVEHHHQLVGKQRPREEDM